MSSLSLSQAPIPALGDLQALENFVKSSESWKYAGKEPGFLWNNP